MLCVGSHSHAILHPPSVKIYKLFLCVHREGIPGYFPNISLSLFLFGVVYVTWTFCYHLKANPDRKTVNQYCLWCQMSIYPKYRVV